MHLSSEWLIVAAVLYVVGLVLAFEMGARSVLGSAPPKPRPMAAPLPMWPNCAGCAMSREAGPTTQARHVAVAHGHLVMDESETERRAAWGDR